MTDGLTGDVEFPIGEYRVLQLLGRGGIGEVYVAQRRGSTELLALKRLRPEVAGRRAAQARFRREAQIASLLDHPNICRVVDAGYEDEGFFIASEFVYGVDLERLILALAERRLAMATDRVLAVILPVLDGLAHAHAATDAEGRPLGLVHRDLSPRNIMVTFDGAVKIIDFGVARANVDDFRTAPGVLVGTLKFLSPEQALGEPVDRRSDLYSLSAVMYEMLTGRSVVRSGKDMLEALEAIVHETPRPARRYNPSVSEALAAVLERGLAKRPDDRFGSAEAMASALRTVAGAPARPEELARLVRELFDDLHWSMQALRERAQASLTPSPRARSAVDPFEATAYGPVPDELQIPTRTGAASEPPPEETRTLFRTEIQRMRREDSQLLPTRLDHAPTPVVPAPTETGAPEPDPTHLASPPTAPPRPTAGSPRPRGRVTGLAAAVAVVAGAGAVVWWARPSPAPVVIEPEVAEVVAAPAPSAAPRAEPAAPVPAAPPAARAPRRRRQPPAAAPKPAVRRSDPLAARLATVETGLESTGYLDYDELGRILAAAGARAGGDEGKRRVREAEDCLQTCGDPKTIFARARRALGATR